MVANGSHIASGWLETHYLHDIAPTALAFFGLRAEASDGSPIEEISGSTGDEVTVQGESGIRRTDDLTDEQRQQIADHLRDLGYIE